MAATRSDARGFLVLPGLDFGEMGSFAAIFFALAGGTPSMAAARCAGERFWGGGSFFVLVGCFFVVAIADRVVDLGLIIGLNRLKQESLL